MIELEEALVLGTLAFSFPRDILEKLKSLPGVTDANFIYGPYDFYVFIKTESKEALGNTIMKIRAIDGIHSTMTCNVVITPGVEGSPKE